MTYQLFHPKAFGLVAICVATSLMSCTQARNGGATQRAPVQQPADSGKSGGTAGKETGKESGKETGSGSHGGDSAAPGDEVETPTIDTPADETPSTGTGEPTVGNTGKINTGRTEDAGTAGGGAGPGRGTPYKTPPAGYNAAMARQWMTAHQSAKGQGYRYVFLPPELVANAEMSNVLRIAAGKAWNHLSWQTVIDVPEDVSEGHGLVFALNAAGVWGADAQANWGYIANCTPKQNIDISPAPQGDCQTFNDVLVDIPRFVFNAVNGGPYANIHKTPPYFSSFEQQFQLGPILAVSTHKNAIVCGPRITAYRPLRINGVETIYSFSSDEFDGRDNGAINYQNAPTEQDMRSTGAFNAAPGDGNTAIASEWWIQLPNGFIYYGIHGEGSQERGKAEFPFAIDPANWKQEAVLANGRSCITCHANGIQAATSDQELAGRGGWTSNENLATIYSNVRGKFQKAMRTLVDGLSDGEESFNERIISGTIEPISRAILLVEGPFQGDNGFCESFCNGKFGASRANFCSTMPAR